VNLLVGQRAKAGSGERFVYSVGAGFALLVTLMLRGPQTLSELRSNAAPLGGPADADGVERILADLTDRAQPLVALLPRAPGQKEARYAHTLCGPPEAPAPRAQAAAAPAAPVEAPPGRDRSTLAGLEERLRALEARVAALEAARDQGADPTAAA